jgi:hypothetical protein
MLVVEQVEHVDTAIGLLHHMHGFESKSSRVISSK